VATVKSGQRTWEVEASRVAPSTGMANFRQLRFAGCTDSVFLFAPTLGARLFGLLFVAFGAGILSAYVVTFAKGWHKVLPPGLGMTVWMVVGVGFGCMIGITCIGMSLRVLTQTVRFDKAAGTVTRRWLLKGTDVRSLQEIVAVQALDAGLVTVSGGRGSSRVHLFQINLVLEFPPGFRVNVCTEPDEPSIRTAARELADFLGVPLVEQEVP
jgi:hypothetical protein